MSNTSDLGPAPKYIGVMEQKSYGFDTRAGGVDVHVNHYEGKCVRVTMIFMHRSTAGRVATASVYRIAAQIEESFEQVDYTFHVDVAADIEAITVTRSDGQFLSVDDHIEIGATLAKAFDILGKGGA